MDSVNIQINPHTHTHTHTHTRIQKEAYPHATFLMNSNISKMHELSMLYLGPFATRRSTMVANKAKRYGDKQQRERESTRGDETEIREMESEIEKEKEDR